MRYLVLANLTVMGEALRERLRAISADDPAARFHLVLPANRDPDIDQQLARSEHLKWPGESQVVSSERARLRAALDAMREDGLVVTGEVGDPDPVRAAVEAVENGDHDAVIVSTLSSAVSRWLRIDVPRRLSRRLSLPIEHVEATPEAAVAPRGEA